MRLGTKLILAFLLLSVLPLSWITLYSYQSSISVFRKAVESESNSLTEEMGGRMAALKRDLAYRVERLGSFPFTQLMAVKEAKVDSGSNPWMSKLMAEIGDMAPLVDTIEFKTKSAGDGSLSHEPQSPPPPFSDRPEPQQLVIQLSNEPPAVPAAGKSNQDRTATGTTVLRMRPMANRQRLGTELKQIREFQVVLEKIGPPPEGENPRGASGTKASARAAEIRRNLPAANFGAEVRSDGNSIGTVNAHMSSRQMIRNVLSGGRHRPGEISFVVDSDETIYTMNAADQAKLHALGLQLLSNDSRGQSASPALKDWVVVTRKDESSNVTFGIARPISGTLREIRTTAARNLAYGLGIVALALVGIIPLSNRMTRDLAALTQEAEQLAHGNLNARVTVNSRDEIGKLAESFNRMARDLTENQKQLVLQERLQKELEMSRRIQEELLPKQALRAGPVEIKGVSNPTREIGGDFFNYFPLPHGEIAILVGDVSGKGIAAALLMANLQAKLQARLPLEPDLAELARQLDYEIYANTPREVYLTLFMSILDPAQQILRYVNAGHNPQFALHAQTGIELLESTGRPLGLLPGGPFEQKCADLRAGGELFLYTDGLVEAENIVGEQFGQERLESMILATRMKGIDEILAAVEQENRKHRGPIEAADDSTMLVLKIHADPRMEPQSPRTPEKNASMLSGVSLQSGPLPPPVD